MKLTAEAKSVPAKADATRSEWLPLWIHLEDTAGVLEWLYSHWLPESEKYALFQDKPALESQLRLLGLLHDIGKASPAFISHILRAMPALRGPLEAGGILPPAQMEYRVPKTTIGEDINVRDDLELSRDTVVSYTNALKKIFVIEDCPAWSPDLRSKTAIRTSDTRYFVDPSIAAAALGVGPGDLLNDLETCGLFFETLCIRDLRVYTEALGGSVYHFRTKEGLECDAVLHLRNGSYGLVEIKLGGDKLIEEGARTLKTVADKIDTTKMKAPAFLMVLTGTTPYAFRREDGVYVVPVTTLKN